MNFTRSSSETMTNFQATLVNVGYGQLALRDSLGRISQKWTLSNPKCVIGTGTNCNVSCNLPGIVDHHALLVIGTRQVFLRALAPGLTRCGENISEIVISGNEAEFAFELAGHHFVYYRHANTQPTRKEFIVEPAQTVTASLSPETSNSQSVSRSVPSPLVPTTPAMTAPTATTASTSSDRLRFTFVRALEKNRAQTQAGSSAHANDKTHSGDHPAWVEEIVRQALRPVESRLDDLSAPLNNIQRRLRRDARQRKLRRNSRRANPAQPQSAAMPPELIQSQSNVEKLVGQHTSRLEQINQHVNQLVTRLSSVDQLLNNSTNSHQDLARKSIQSNFEISKLQQEMLTLFAQLQSQLERPSTSDEQRLWQSGVEAQLAELQSSMLALDDIKHALEMAVSQTTSIRSDLDLQRDQIVHAIERPDVIAPSIDQINQSINETVARCLSQELNDGIQASLRKSLLGPLTQEVSDSLAANLASQLAAITDQFAGLTSRLNGIPGELSSTLAGVLQNQQPPVSASELSERIAASLGQSISDSMNASLSDSLNASLSASLNESIKASLGETLTALPMLTSPGSASIGQLNDISNAALHQSLSTSLGQSLKTSLTDALGETLGSSLSQSLCESLNESLSTRLNESLSASLNSLNTTLVASVAAALSETLPTVVAQSLSQSLPQPIAQSIIPSVTESLSQALSASLTESVSQTIEHSLASLPQVVPVQNSIPVATSQQLVPLTAAAYELPAALSLPTVSELLPEHASQPEIELTPVDDEPGFQSQPYQGLSYQSEAYQQPSSPSVAYDSQPIEAVGSIPADYQSDAYQQPVVEPAELEEVIELEPEIELENNQSYLSSDAVETAPETNESFEVESDLPGELPSWWTKQQTDSRPVTGSQPIEPEVEAPAQSNWPGQNYFERNYFQSGQEPGAVAAEDQLPPADVYGSEPVGEGYASSAFSDEQLEIVPEVDDTFPSAFYEPGAAQTAAEGFDSAPYSPYAPIGYEPEVETGQYSPYDPAADLPDSQPADPAYAGVGPVGHSGYSPEAYGPEEEMLDAYQPAPERPTQSVQAAENPTVRASEVSSEHQEDGDESVEDYMRRLLARMRGVSENEISLPGIDQNKPGNQPAPKDPSAVKPAPKAEPAANAEQITEDWTEPFDPDKYVPRGAAPEKNKDLNALRELANNSARSAIQVSARRRQGSAILLKSAIAFVGLFAGVALVSINGARINIAFIATIASFLVALIWGYDTITSMRPLVQAMKGPKDRTPEPQEPV